MAKRLLVALASTPAALIGCHSSDGEGPDGRPMDPPVSVTEVSSGGFQSPTDAVASPDGRTFYFAAWDLERQPALFQVSSAPGSAATVLATGAPLDAPLGLVLSCDGATLFIADMGGETGGILQAPASGGAASALAVTGLVRPGSLAIGADCASLFATGKLDDEARTPAVFEVPLAGGAARVVHQGAPLVSPTGIHVDGDGVAWVMDHHAQGADGAGVLFAIGPDGEVREIASKLRMGTPGGVTLTAGGGFAVIPTRDDNDATQLTSVDVATGAVTQLSTPSISAPAGLHSARSAGVIAVVDPEASKIFRAQ